MGISSFSKKEMHLRIEKALEPFPELQKIFDQRWLKGHVEGLSERQLAQLQEWMEGKHIDLDEQSPHLLLFWALLPVTPNPPLKAINDAIVFLRYAGVKRLDKKAAALKDKKVFWQTLSEIYLAAHLQRAGASVKEFDPTSGYGLSADLRFVIDDLKCVVEVHTFTPKKPEPPEKLIEGIIDPLQKAMQKWRKKKGQLATQDTAKLHIFAESINLMPAEAQFPFIMRELFEGDLFGLPPAKEVCQQAFNEGLDAIALFAIDPPTGLIWAIRWYWRDDRKELVQRFRAFQDYPKRENMRERASLKNLIPILPIGDFFLATVLDYFEDGLLTASEATEAISNHYLGKLPLSVEQFLQIAHKHGISYFRMTEEEWQREREVARECLR